MAQYKKALLAAFAPGFKAAGFKKKAATWHRVRENTIDVFNVQTSQWSEYYYFNAGIYLRALGSHETPPSYQCDIQTRVPRSFVFNPERKQAWDRWMQLADFASVGADADRKVQELKELVFPLAIEWFTQFQDLETIKRTLRDARSADTISQEVWPYLGIERAT